MGLDVHDKDGDRFDTDHFIVHMAGNGLRYRSLYVHEQQSHKYKEASFGEGERRTVH
jgi:hypothetical protein